MRGGCLYRPQAVYQMLFDRQGLRFEQTPEGITVFGRLRPGGFTLPGDVSSQFISGLLFAAPLMESESSIEVLPPYESRSYVDLTIDAMQQFGVKVAARARKNGSVMYRVAAPQRYTASDFAVEGDYSQAAFSGRAGLRGRRHQRGGAEPRQPAGRQGHSGYFKALRRKV